MRLLDRATAAAAFGWDITRATSLAVATSLRREPATDDGANEVHLLIEGDPARGLSPAARYRALQFVPLLDTMGFQCRVHASQPAKYFTAHDTWQRRYARWPRLAMLQAIVGHWQQARHRRRDFRELAGRGVVFLQRDLRALPDWSLERELPLYNRHLVFDFDDAIFVQPPWARAAGASGVDEALRQKIAGICATASCVIAANAHLAEFASQHAPRVHVVPTVLCTDEFRPAATPPANRRPVIGWVGTSGNLWYLRRLGPALHALAQRRDFVLRVVCNRVDRQQLDGLPAANLEFVEWSPVGEVERIQQFDIGIMPLDDDAWSRGKAGFKMVQYMACGVPFVASPVGANAATGGKDGECGLYASSVDDWIDRLDALLFDAGRRLAMGQRGRARAVQHFDRRVHAPTIAAILREAARV